MIRDVKPWTMTSPEKLNALILSVRHVVKHDIPGDIVECGVWRGGSMQAAADWYESTKHEFESLYTRLPPAASCSTTAGGGTGPRPPSTSGSRRPGRLLLQRLAEGRVAVKP